MTEKASHLLENNAYTFVVRRDATKYDVRDAVRERFGVIPKKVAMVNHKPRRSPSRTRGRVVHVAGMKKAVVFLKNGDRIDFV